MEKLSDDLTQAFKKNKTLEVENKDFVEEVNLHSAFIFSFTYYFRTRTTLYPNFASMISHENNKLHCL
jgi:hypothetical protein